MESFWRAQIVGWATYFVVNYLTFLTTDPSGDPWFLILFKLFRAATGFLLSSVALRPIYRRFASHVSVERAVFLVLACSTLLGIVWTVLEFVYIQFISIAPSVPGYLARSPRSALGFAMTLAAWSALYLGVTFWRRWQTERENALEAMALTRAAQLQMLRYQINPHFLFNALNSVRALVDEDAARARTMITRLSEFLRYSLMNEDRPMVLLSEELEAVTNYLEIEKIRFEEKLDVAFDVEVAAKEREVPSFVLNPLIENAVKYGFRSSTKPLRIRVHARIVASTLIIEVANTGSLAPEPPSGDRGGVGLDNVRRRLEKLYGARGTLALTQEHDWVKATIEMPA